MRYLSVCSGIEAASVAWQPLGWQAVALAEIEPFPCAVLAHHYPDVPNLGDMLVPDWRKYRGSVDLVVAGTPCFPAGTLVLTPKGYVPIESITVGSPVISALGNVQTVQATGSKLARVGKMKISGRPEIRCTPNHPFLCIGTARDRRSGATLPIGDYEATRADAAIGLYAARLVPKKMPAPAFPAASSASPLDIVEFAGWYADAGYTRKFRGKNRKAVYLTLAGRKKLDTFKTRFKGVLDFDTRGRLVTIPCTALADWLAEHFGRRSRRIPYWVYCDPYRKAFLRGYRNANGHGDGMHTRFTTASQTLACGVADLNPNSSVRIGKHQSAKSRTYMTTLNRETTPSLKGRFCSRVQRFSLDEKSKPVRVYNLTVANEHTYVVNGIAVHNCQSFSVAGQRQGLEDRRGNLALHFCELVNHVDPAFVLWENVPGIFTDRGNAFGYFLGALAGEKSPLFPPGGKWTNAGYVLGTRRAICWRVLDAQYFGLAQRRRRVYALACPRDGADPRKILFEFSGLRRDSAPCRKTQTNPAGQPQNGSGESGICQCLTGSLGNGGADDNRAQAGFYVPEIVRQPICSKWSKGTSGPAGDEHHNLVCTPLTSSPYADNASQEGKLVVCPTISFHGSQDPVTGDIASSLGRNQGRECCVNHADSVRRLTPRECERLMGFPDDYTNVTFRKKPATDSHRYKALGNAMAVPVMRWLGQRIAVELNPSISD